MKKELDYFYVGNSYGGSQDWFRDVSMKIGGCAAVTACECCIYLDMYKGTKLYPFDINNIKKRDYIKFASVMKPYLHPRFTGIDKLDIYIDGFSQYLTDNKSSIKLSGFSGNNALNDAKGKIKLQIDKGIPVPYLNLHHNDKQFKDYEWHWFILNGYEEFEDNFMVKAVNYSTWQWMDFNALWNTGHKNKGGFIIIDI